MCPLICGNSIIEECCGMNEKWLPVNVEFRITAILHNFESCSLLGAFVFHSGSEECLFLSRISHLLLCCPINETHGIDNDVKKGDRERQGAPAISSYRAKTHRGSESRPRGRCTNSAMIPKAAKAPAPSPI